MKTLIKTNTIASPEGICSGQNILIQNGIIREIVPDSSHTPTDHVIDVSKYLVAPGFMDIHTHGAVGYNFISANHEQLDFIGTAFAKHGVTRYLATLMENDPYKFDQAIHRFQTYCPAACAAIPIGIHLEGPYLCPKYPGDMGKKQVRIPNPAEYLPWFDSGIVRMITVAPELPGAIEMITAAKERGIIVSIGHGSPNDTQVHTAFDAGASQITHIFNQMLGLDHHQAGLIDAALLNDSVALQIIADKDHLHPVTLKVLTKLKSPQYLILVTDSTEENGLNLSIPFDNKAIAGTLTMDQAVRNILEHTKVEPINALQMASTSPATSLNLENTFGSIQPGVTADFVVLDQQMQVVMTLINGNIAYQADIKIV